MEGSQPTWDKNNLAARDHSVGASLEHYNSLRTHVQLTNRFAEGNLSQSAIEPSKGNKDICSRPPKSLSLDLSHCG